MRTFLSKVRDFLGIVRGKELRVRVLAEGVGISVRAKGYESLLLELYDVSREGFSVVLQDGIGGEREIFFRGVCEGKEFEFEFLYSEGLNLRALTIKARPISVYENESRYVFYVKRSERGKLWHLYEVVRALRKERGEGGGREAGSCGVQGCGLRSCSPLEHVQRLYYLSLLEEKKLLVREKKFKLSFFLIAVLLFLVSGGVWDTMRVQSEEMRFRRMVEEYERRNNAKVMYLVHRKRQVGIWGMPVYEYLEVYDAHRLLRELRKVEEEREVVLIVHSPGGQLLAGIQIAKILKERKGRVKVVVPYYAMSAGTLIALSADEIYAGEGAVFGPIDPQIPVGRDEFVPAVVVKSAYGEARGVDLKGVMLYKLSVRALKQMEDFLREELLREYREEQRRRLIERLLYTDRTHDFPIFVEELRELGVKVKVGIPEELKEIVSYIVERSIFTQTS